MLKSLKHSIFIALFFILAFINVEAEEKPFQNANNFFEDENYFFYGADSSGLIKVNKYTHEKTTIYKQYIHNIYDGEDVIFFNMDGKKGIYSIAKDGTDLKRVIDVQIQDFIYYNDYLYYIAVEDLKVHKVDLNGKEHVKSNLNFYNVNSRFDSLVVHGNEIYVSNPSNAIYALDSQTLEGKQIIALDDYCTHLYVDDTRIYYTTGYYEDKLYSYDKSTGETTFIEDSVNSYFAFDNKLYYNTGSLGLEPTKTYIYDLITDKKVFFPINFDGYYYDTYNDYIQVGGCVYQYADGNFNLVIDNMDESDNSLYLDILNKAFKASMKQSNFQKESIYTIDFGDLQRNLQYVETFDSQESLGYYHTKDIINYNDNKFVSEESYWFIDDSVLADYGSDNLEAYTFIANIEDYDPENYNQWQSDLFNSIQVDFYNVSENDAYYIYELSKRSTEELIDDENSNIYMPSEGIIDYQSFLFINKSTGLIDKLICNSNFKPNGFQTSKAPIYRPYNNVALEIIFSYSDQPIINPSKELDNYISNLESFITLFEREDATILELSTTIEKYIDDKNLYDIYYSAFLSGYDGTANEDLYNNFLTYCEYNPDDLEALFTLLQYELNHHDSYSSLAYDALMKDWYYRSDTYDLLYSDFVWKGDYEAADKILEQWLKDYPYDSRAIEAMIDTYVYNGQHEEAIAYAEDLRYFLSDTAHWYLAMAYSATYDTINAAEQYEYAWNSDNVDYLYDYMLFAYYQMNYDKALECADAILAIDPDGYAAQYIKNDIETNNLLLDGAALVNLFKNNYLFYETTDELSGLEEEFKKKETLLPEEIQQYFDAVIKKDDQFSYLFGLQDISLPESSVTTKTGENTFYISLDQFGLNASDKVIEALSTIENPAATTLILDLRNNPGGSTYEADLILDALLPDVVPATQIFKDGSMESMYSDEYSFPFKDIYLLINNKSASASELVTLSLSEYLDHVTVVGQQSYGKGIGQATYTNLEYGYELWLVNFWWNVRQRNINEIGVTPDIIVEGDTLEDYINAIPVKTTLQ